MKSASRLHLSDCSADSRRSLLVGSVLLSCLGLYYLLSNIGAPVQRDGAHFIFMAQQIALGHAPYWASFETKNPLVELFWSPFIALLGPSLGYEPAARIAETLWMVATAILMFTTAARWRPGADSMDHGRQKPPMLCHAIALGCAAVYLALALDVRATDDGLNISLYQALPELALISLLLTPPRVSPAAHGAIIGGLFFAAWFVKQTSALTLGGTLLVYICATREARSPKWLLGLFAGALVPTIAFALHLLVTGTLIYYWLGTHAYKASMASATSFADFWTSLQRLYGFSKIPASLDEVLRSHYLWSTILTVALSVWAGLTIFRARQDRHVELPIILSTTWMVLSLVQALGSVMFFLHYFLASLAPVAFVLTLLLMRARPNVGAVGVLICSASTAILVVSYWNVGATNRARAAEAPINRSVDEVMRFIKPGDKIWNWTALPHFLVAYAAPSAYPQNMSWPHIISTFPTETRQALLGEVARTPPDAVIVMQENYSMKELLIASPKTAERLFALTGHRYELVYATDRRPGRYGASVQLFRRQ